MKKVNLEWLLFTAAGAIIGTIAVDAYKKNKARIQAEKAKSGIPNEILVIEKL